MTTLAEILDPTVEPAEEGLTIIEQPAIILQEPLWELQTILGESDKEYRGFLLYADLSPEERNLQAAWQAFSGKHTRYPGKFRLWSTRYFWERRASALDIWKLRQERNDWIIKDDDRRRADFTSGERLRGLAMEKLNAITGMELSPMQAARFVELASELQSAAIPNTLLGQREIQQLMASLPETRRASVIALLLARFSE